MTGGAPVAEQQPAARRRIRAGRPVRRRTVRRRRGQAGTQPPPQAAAGRSARRHAAPSRTADARLRRVRRELGRGRAAHERPGRAHAAAGAAAGDRRCRQMGSAGPTLFLVYNGQRYPVTKDQFIIGRGSKTSDLAIKDGNISRKHAAVIRRNGTFYIKDLGSTNGIDYKGMRIDNKRIDEGDVFHLCDYELRFTYRAD